MNNSLIILIVQKGEIVKEMDTKIMKEINKVYKDLKINKNQNSDNKLNYDFSRKIGIYDNNKKSYLDNKTSIRARYSYYG